MTEVRANIGLQFDPTLAHAFLRAAEKRGLIVPLTLPIQLPAPPSPAPPARRLKYKRASNAQPSEQRRAA